MLFYSMFHLTFSHLFSLLGLLSETAPRTDCPTTLATLPETDSALFEIQRTKPLNDHLEAQMLFYCQQVYPEAHAAGELKINGSVFVCFVPEWNIFFKLLTFTIVHA